MPERFGENNEQLTGDNTEKMGAKWQLGVWGAQAPKTPKSVDFFCLKHGKITIVKDQIW